MGPQPKRPLVNVQILRGFAAIAVVLYHLDGDSHEFFNHAFFHFTYGNLGVDFFFALSGFIITYMHLSDIEHRGSIRKFLLKRVVRIYPMYWLTLIITLLIIAPEYKGSPELVAALDMSTVTGWITMIKNFLLFPIHGEFMPVRIAWSLIYEMVFYIVFAACIALGWKKSRILFFVWLALVLIYSRDVIDSTTFTEFTFGALIIEFMFGCIAGYLFLKMKRQLTFPIFASVLATIAGIFIVYFILREFNRFSIYSTILLGAASALIILYAATLDRLRTRPAKRILPLLGDASYSIYITHSIYSPFICKTFAEAFNVQSWEPLPKNAIIIAVFIITLAIGVIIHLYIEKPVTGRLRKALNLKSSSKD